MDKVSKAVHRINKMVQHELQARGTCCFVVNLESASVQHVECWHANFEVTLRSA